MTEQFGQPVLTGHIVALQQLPVTKGERCDVEYIADVPFRICRRNEYWEPRDATNPGRAESASAIDQGWSSDNPVLTMSANTILSSQFGCQEPTPGRLLQAKGAYVYESFSLAFTGRSEGSRSTSMNSIVSLSSLTSRCSASGAAG